jgi:hypothetical protein
VRTWDENRASINQLWPQCQWTDEERRLWHDDLHALDQPMLYDALRNVKRNHDTLYPQLKWILDSYRELAAARKLASRPQPAREEKLKLNIDDEEDRKMTADFLALVDLSQPSDFAAVEKKVLDIGLPKMHSRSAVRVLNYARLRLLGEEPMFSRVTRVGDLVPMTKTVKEFA